MIGLAVSAGAPAVAQDWNPANSFSPNQARDEVSRGKIVPLKSIFRQLKREYGGYQLGAALFSKPDGGAVYNIEWMSEEGRKMTIVVDAETGRIVRAS